jgi:D-alanyl-lipoteichoic acid acyltransferase DltB (MBOAT superfamily)
MLHQFHEKHYFDYKSVTDGLKLMLWGMVKKVVIADRLAIITDPVFNSPHNYPAITLLIAAFFFSFQIFCDFSGYSDIALGAAQVMGFRLMVNFKRPYHSRSVSEFWTRWHISLSTWFRDYLYIPLGGNRVGVPRWYFNLYFVFLVSGFWHGANWTFIVWGALHGIYLIVALTTAKFRTRLTEKTGLSAIPWLNQSLQIISTFVLVMIAWVFFRANNIKDAVYILTRLPLAAKDFLHSVKTHQIWLGKIGEEYLTPGFFVPSFLLILFMEAVHIFQSRTSPIAFLDRQPIYIRWAVYYSILILLWTGATESRQFIYFQF